MQHECTLPDGHDFMNAVYPFTNRGPSRTELVDTLDAMQQ
jgi:hypothetical protein